jgi:acyl dehydratase
MDQLSAVDSPVPESTFAWDPRKVALYHLGIGAGAEAEDLPYLLEETLVPFPTFATLACFPALIRLNQVPGLEGLDLARVLHGEHLLELGGPIPREGAVTTRGWVEAVEAKRSGARIQVRQESRYIGGEPAWINRYVMFARGAEGIATRTAQEPLHIPRAPDVEPSAVVRTPTLPQQAQLYRHSGDNNPLHLDPAYAKAGGFDKPILQGLCTLGFAARSVVDQLLSGDSSRVRTVAARFTAPVIPGDTLDTAMWIDQGRVSFTTRTNAGSDAISRGLIKLIAE